MNGRTTKTQPEHAKRVALLTQAQIAHAFDYNPETGILKWKNPTGSRVRAGYVAGTPDKDGYLQTRIFGLTIKVHRLIFLYMEGSFPNGEVDHINRIPSDNRWSNLRIVTRQQNCWNTGMRSHNSSGVKGVSWCNQKSKWRGLVTFRGKYHHVGYFEDIRDAEAAVRSRRSEMHGEFTSPI